MHWSNWEASGPLALITCVGAIVIDEVARLEQALHPGASNPVSWTRSLGGVAANVYAAAHERASACLISAIGDDAMGVDIRSMLAGNQHATDGLCLYPGYQSGRYCAVLDQQGELILGLASTEVVELLDHTSIRAALARLNIRSSTAEDSHIIVVDTNLSTSCLRALCENQPDSTLVVMTVSPIKAMRIVDQAANIDILMTNRRESAELTNLPITSDIEALSDGLLQHGFPRHVITDGDADLIVTEHSSRQRIAVPVLTTAGSVNGAGDALAGASLAAVQQGKPLAEAVRDHGLGAAAAVITRPSVTSQIRPATLTGAQPDAARE